MNKNIELEPMRVPDFVIVNMPARPRQDGFRVLPKFYLKELDAQILSGLCDEFRASVFEKAGIEDPKSKP